MVLQGPKQSSIGDFANIFIIKGTNICMIIWGIVVYQIMYCKYSEFQRKLENCFLGKCLSCLYCIGIGIILLLFSNKKLGLIMIEKFNS